MKFKIEKNGYVFTSYGENPEEAMINLYSKDENHEVFNDFNEGIKSFKNFNISSIPDME